MRRSTAAAVGTLAGAALIVGVRLSVEPPEAPVAAPPPVDLAAEDAKGGAGGDGEKKEADPKPSESKKGEKKEEEKPKSGLQDGVFKGSGQKNPYGTVQVQIKIENGEITRAEATYPTTGDSATINPPAIAQLKESTLQAQNADVEAVSGATFTSESYAKSLQAALDAAKA